MLCSIFCLLILFSPNSIRAQPEPSETFTHNAQLEAHGKIHLYWKFNETHITFEVHGNTEGWVGIGFSPSGSMMGADMNVGWVKNGEATITDRHGVISGNTFPPLDTEQNVELLGGSECDGWTVLKFRRQLAACDHEDMEITTDTMRVIFAWGLDDPAGEDISGADYHGSERRGVKVLLLLDQPNFGQWKYPEGERHFHFDLISDKFNLPDEDTYYNCLLLKLPQLTTKHHLVKIEPVIDEGNEMNVHHMVITLCADQNLDDTSVGLNARWHTTNMPPDFSSCVFVMYAWAIGGSTFYYPNHVGYPLGTSDAPKYVVLQIHYDNPQKKSDIADSSGFRLTYTPDLRQHDAGILEVGVRPTGLQHVIPPNAESFDSFGDCTSDCLSYSLEQDGFASIKVFAVMLHSHLLGRKLALKHIRNGTELKPLLSDQAYDINYQETRILTDERTVMKGDTMRVVCSYDTVGKTGITMGGMPTTSEMCLAFVHIYPKMALSYCLTVPKLSTLMNYFGFESYSKVDYTNFQYVGLNDIEVWKPAKYANKTALENINAMQWNEAEVKKFEKDLTTMISFVVCYGSQYAMPPTYQEPIEITNPYLVEQLNCTVPSSGFPLSGVTSECSATSAPVTTTSGACGHYNVDWLFWAWVVAFVQYLTG